MNELPDRLPRNYIINAIRAYDDGFPHLFKEARRYEVEFEGRRYPSKAIAGIAATLMTGKTFTPNDFSGGIKSKCVRLLIEQGFHIVQGKKGDAPVSDTLFPDEIAPQIDYVEGAAMQVVVNRYERDRNARQKALEHHGYQCKVCGVDMSKIYGEIGNVLSMFTTWYRCRRLKRITIWIPLMILFLSARIAMRCCTDKIRH